MRYPKKEQEEAREWFLKNTHKGETVYTVLRHVSASGMSRKIGLILIKPGKRAEDEIVIFHPNWSAARLLGLSQDPHNDAVKIGGCGMDMGYHLVHSIAQAVYGDGYALKHRWL